MCSELYIKNNNKTREEIPLTEKILLTIPEIATLTKSNVSKIRELVHAGLLTSLKLGEVKVRRTDLDAFLEKYSGYDLSDVNNIKKLAFNKK